MSPALTGFPRILPYSSAFAGGGAAYSYGTLSRRHHTRGYAGVVPYV